VSAPVDVAGSSSSGSAASGNAPSSGSAALGGDGGRPGALTLERVTRRFAGNARDRADAPPAVDALTLEVRAGELLALVGASGSGKTTTLRMAAGYETPDDGRVLLDGRDNTALPR
jgi:ABC-type glutathione transport system ATPase component